jgi:RNA polymerase sigma-70 factor (ECF subfamily)
MAKTLRPTTLLSDEPTVELIIKARRGDAAALEAILQRCLPSLKRWARGRLPTAARGHMDTGDLVQEAGLHAIAKLESFEPRHVGAMQAYLRQSVMNKIRDEVRRLERRRIPIEVPEDLASDDASPLEQAIANEKYDRYRGALEDLRSKDRAIIVARLEAQWTIPEIASRFGFRSSEAARMAVTRAVRRLTVALATKAKEASEAVRGDGATISGDG